VFDKDHIPPRVIGIEIEKWRFEMSEKVQLALSRYNKDKFQMKTVELVKGSFNADVPLMKSATHLFLLDLLFHPDTLAILSSNVLNTEDSHWMVLISCLPPKVWMGKSQRFGKEVHLTGLRNGVNGVVKCLGRISVSLAKSTQHTSLYLYARNPVEINSTETRGM